jgi:hypothetical protein
MAIEIAEEIFDENLAAEALSEEREVRPHDGSQIQQNWSFTRRQTADKFSECFGRKNLAFVRECGTSGSHACMGPG